MEDKKQPPKKDAEMDYNNDLDSESETQSAGYEEDAEADSPPEPKTAASNRKRKYVEKGSLSEGKILKENGLLSSTKSKDDPAEEEKKERRAANRLSAYQSRQRRMNIIEELKKTVASLTKANAEQHHEIDRITKELTAARATNSSLQAQLSATGRTESMTSQAKANSSQQRHSQGSRMPPANPFRVDNRGMSSVNPEVMLLLKELATVETQLANMKSGGSDFLKQNVTANSSALSLQGSRLTQQRSGSQDHASRQQQHQAALQNGQRGNEDSQSQLAFLQQLLGMPAAPNQQQQHQQQQQQQQAQAARIQQSLLLLQSLHNCISDTKKGGEAK